MVYADVVHAGRGYTQSALVEQVILSPQLLCCDGCGASKSEGAVDEIVAAGGIVSSESRWVSESGPGGLFLSDEATDWIEAVANDES